MTHDKMDKANKILARRSNLSARIEMIDKLLRSAEKPLYGDSGGVEHKLMMTIKPLGWSGPNYEYFTSEEILDILNEHRESMELEISDLTIEFENL